MWQRKTDDVGIFQSTLSNEYLLASKHFGLTHRDLLDLCEEASNAIFADEKHKHAIQRKIAELRNEVGSELQNEIANTSIN